MRCVGSKTGRILGAGDGSETWGDQQGFLVMGFAIGLPQWALIRRHYSGASIWLLGSSAGTAMGLWLVLTTGLVNQSEIVSYILIILFYAAFTGLVLTRLLARHNQPQDRPFKTPLPLTGE